MIYQSSFVVFPEHTNYMLCDMVFGGKMLSEIDIAAHTAVRRLINYQSDLSQMVHTLLPVTVGIEKCSFTTPAYVGDTIEIYAKVISVGVKSIKCHVTYKVIRNAPKNPVENMGECIISFVTLSYTTKKPVPHYLTMD